MLQKYCTIIFDRQIDSFNCILISMKIVWHLAISATYMILAPSQSSIEIVSVRVHSAHHVYSLCFSPKYWL